MIWKEECLNIKNKLIEDFTNRYELDKLVYFEQFQFVNDAIKREKQLKNWNRQWKIDLIDEDNKSWKDLSFDWFD
jgi:putative endonuclease